jgi:hypothetical protein
MIEVLLAVCFVFLYMRSWQFHYNLSKFCSSSCPPLPHQHIL